ncbi:MAG: GYD domain-containing protein [Candidatus Latescibacterota bacterium]|nr:MAG: GYD domain-containing protein [Candidatus Latescibacterota bacterium]
MPTFVLMTKLSPEVTRDMKKRETIGREWKDEVDKRCPGIRWIDHYALLGPYDFMDVFEAPSEEVAAKVSMISLARGALQAESWTAIPYSRFVELTKEI